MESVAQYRDKAKEMYESEGTIEFDDDPDVSLSTDGAYVQAWVWVGRADLEEED